MSFSGAVLLVQRLHQNYNCGIAIKNNQSLFLVRTCGTGSTAKMNIGSSSPYIERRNCDQSSMIIEEYGNFYQVTLPTGTEIEFYIADGLIPVININPSVLDVENTDGLCGFISSDGNAYDDFISRDNFTTVHVEEWLELEKARTECEHQLTKRISPAIFTFVPMLSIKDYIESCIIDIKSAGDTRFLKDTVMAIQLFSKKEAHRYSSMNDSSMLFQRVNTVLCIDNCNGKGKCISGKCVCNDGYIGISCSSHISIPPHVLALPEDGLCDSVNRPCKKQIFMENFIQKTSSVKVNIFLLIVAEKNIKRQSQHPKPDTEIIL
ncbi:unnamed protein product [Mytilus edulis]|uniref:Vwde helical domain-containing protein n=1 Tax=Mytilus edulis TaxID=6550 RepID=A0A8S3S777_MYTED|nr:unnamed protein product [Mytilus edulis]